MAQNDTINAEIFTLTYGSIVRQLVSDLEDVNEVNVQLEKMGYGIGQRLVDEFVARSRTTRCTDPREIVDRIARLGFKMFLSTTATVAGWSADGREATIVLEDNPLTDFVELPESLGALKYCNILPGVIRGALEMVNVDAECEITKDPLAGDDATEIRIRFLRAEPESYPFKNDE